jgi:opacity protein-like surface antigen
VIVTVAAAVLLVAAAAGAQTRQAGRPPSRPAISVRGFGDVGSTLFAAGDSFTATLGSRRGLLVGGGGEVVFAAAAFVGVRVSRFRAAGSRVFVFGDQVFDLGIATRVALTPIEVSAGYRFARSGRRLVPYVGAGVGWHRYRETSDFATNAENVAETHAGYHVLGGGEYRLLRYLAVAGEAQWTRVPGALGTDPSSASAAFGETDLGGPGFRVKVIVGR